MVRFKSLFALCGIFLLVAIAGNWAFNLDGNRLSSSDHPGTADVIVCLSASDDRAFKTAELYKQGVAERVVVTSVRSRQVVAGNGVPRHQIYSVENGGTTFQEALNVMALLNSEKFHSALVVTDPYHLFRAKWTYTHLKSMNDMRFTFIVSEPPWAKGSWWGHKESRARVMREVPAVIYYWVAHGLLGIDKNPEWVVLLDRWYRKMLDKYA